MLPAGARNCRAGLWQKTSPEKENQVVSKASSIEISYNHAEIADHEKFSVTHICGSRQRAATARLEAENLHLPKVFPHHGQKTFIFLRILLKT